MTGVFSTGSRYPSTDYSVCSAQMWKLVTAIDPRFATSRDRHAQLTWSREMNCEQLMESPWRWGSGGRGRSGSSSDLTRYDWWCNQDCGWVMRVWETQSWLQNKCIISCGYSIVNKEWTPLAFLCKWDIFMLYCIRKLIVYFNAQAMHNANRNLNRQQKIVFKEELNNVEQYAFP